MYEWGDSSADPAAFNVLHAIKVMLFRDQASRMQLAHALNTLNPETAIKKLLLRESEQTLQVILAPALRAATIAHMRTSSSSMMQQFRHTYETIHSQSSAILSKNLTAFLNHSAQSGNWSTEVHANALGNLLNVNVHVITMSGYKVLKDFILHQSSVPSAPTIRLFNDSNVHWYLDPSKREATLPDGNCLYNAFAQALRQQALWEKNKQAAPDVAGSPSTSTTYLKQLEQAKLLSMKAMVKHIKDANSEIERCEIDKLADVMLTELALTPKITTVLKKQRLLVEETTPILKRKSAVKKAARHTPERYRFIPEFYDDARARDFYEVLSRLNVKAVDLQARNRLDRKIKIAADVALKLHFDLNNAAILYFNEKKLTSQEFVAICHAHINKARPVLERHRGWKQVLGNIALAVAGLGIGYLIAGAINKKLTGNFFFFRTDSANTLDEVKEVVATNARKRRRS